jgi:hypothetical protein
VVSLGAIGNVSRFFIMVSFEVKSISFDQAAPFIGKVGSLVEYEDQVNKGELGCFGAFDQGLLVCAFAMKMVEDIAGDQEAVMVAGCGSPGYDFTNDIIPIFEADALKRGAKSFRLHTFRPGLICKLAKRATKKKALIISWSLLDG